MSIITPLRFFATAVVLGWVTTTGSQLSGDPAAQSGSARPLAKVIATAARIEPGVYYIAARQIVYGRLEVPAPPIGQGSGDITCTVVDNSPQQRWYITPDAERPGRYTITCNAGRDAYLQPKIDPGPLPLQTGGGINEPGRPIWYYPRWDTGYQSWTFTRAPGYADVYTITNDGSGLVMSLKESDPTRVEQAEPTGSLRQLWVLVRVE